MENQNKEIVTKTIKLEKNMCDKIQKMAEQSERDFSKQVRFIITEYINLIEKK